jgi:hypothetical protein
MNFNNAKEFSYKYDVTVSSNIEIQGFLGEIITALKTREGYDLIDFINMKIEYIIHNDLSLSEQYVYKFSIFDIQFQSIESILSILLFCRAKEYCSICQDHGNMFLLEKAFVDLNFAITTVQDN